MVLRGRDAGLGRPAGSQQFTDIDGERVVWQGSSTINNLTRDRIYFRDISSGSSSAYMLVYSTTHQQRPAISGDLVVWLEGSTQKVIRSTRISGGCPESSCTGSTPPNWNSSARPVEVAVSGNRIIWTDERAGSGNADIYLIDLGQPGQPEQVISVDAQGQPAPGRQDSPAIEGDWVVWVSAGSVHAKNLVTGQELVNAGDMPAISGQRLVYRSIAVNGFWLRDLANPASPSVMISGSAGSNPDIDGDYVVWSSSDAPARVKLYDIATTTEQEVTSGEGSVYHPAVAAQEKGMRVVWTDDRVNPRNIYTAKAEMRLGELMGSDTCCGVISDPVNTATGAFFDGHTDIDIPTKGLPLSIERTYNSNDQRDGPFGYGWSFNWQMGAIVEGDGDVLISRGDGRRDTFTLNPDGSYNPPSGRHDTFIKNPDSTYTLSTREKVTYAFDSAGQLASVTTATGQQMLLGYEGGRLDTITAPDGRTLTLTWDGGHIASVSYPHGSETYSVAYGYSPAGDLTSVTDQNGGLTTYEYDSEHQITAIRDPKANAGQPLGDPVISNVYSGGRVSEQRDAGGDLVNFDYSLPYQTTITRVMDPNDPAKNQVRVQYHDEYWRLVRETDTSGLDTTYEYDSAGNRYRMTDRRGVVTRQVFDASGNVTDLYRAEGLPEEEHTHTTFNSMNRPLTVTDPRGQTASYTYDASGLLLMQVGLPLVTDYNGGQAGYSESFTYNADGLVATATDRNGDVTTFTYDANGYPDIVTRNAGAAPGEEEITDYDYDDLGRKTAETDPRDNTTSYSYDAIGSLLSATTQVTDPDSGLPQEVVSAYTYDPNGNRTSVTDPEGNTTSFEYDAMNRLWLTTDALNNTIENTYDAAGNRTGIRDRNGNWTYFFFDRENRPISQEDPEHNLTSYGYDAEGNQVTVTDPLLNTVTKSYNGLGRVTSVIEPDEDGALRTTSYAYDKSGNIISETDPLLNSSTYVYDELGRLRQQTDPTGYATFFAYDGMGNQVKIKDPRGNETVYGYSASDRLTSVTDPLGQVSAYGYDKGGNLISQIDPLAHVTLYAYDELGRQTAEKVVVGAGGFLLERGYRYDKAGNLTRDITGEGTISYSYDDVYNLTGVTDRQAATYSYAYDADQNQLTATDDTTGKTVAYSYTPRGQIDTYTDAHGASQNFTYDGAGQVIAREDQVAGQNITTSYGYTPRGQQKSVSRYGNTTTFSYDEAGRMATKSYPNGVSDTIAYDAAGRVTALETANASQTLNSYSQTYDPAGNLTQRGDLRTGTSTYAYDQLNRLVSENVASYGQIGYTYDAAGNRLSQTLPNPAGGPQLSVSWTNSYWASQEDYENRILSVNYRITNNGPGNATQTRVTNSTAEGGAYLVGDVPQDLGAIDQGAFRAFTLRYYVPEGIENLQTVVYATCRDAAGKSHYFPQNRDFYTYNEANQLTSILDSDGVTTGFSYDQTGALTEKAYGTDTTTMTYNGMDKLTRVATPSETVDYSYDALGRRTQRVKGQSSYRQLHLGATDDYTYYETDYAGALTAETLMGADGHIAYTAHLPSMSITAYHSYNPHGDTTLLTSVSGQEWIDYSYDAFGGQLDPNSLSFGYTGKWQRMHDSDTKMIRMGVRDYDPALGRFISTDPLRGSMTDPQSRNRYGYALNNPLTVYDLDGRIAIAPAAAPIIIGGGLIAVGVLAGNEEVRGAGEDLIDQTGETVSDSASDFWEDWKTGYCIWPGWGCGSETPAPSTDESDSGTCIIPWLDSDEYAIKVGINYAKEPSSEFGKSIDDLERSLSDQDGKWVLRDKKELDTTSSAKNYRGGKRVEETYENTETGERIRKNRIFDRNGNQLPHNSYHRVS